MACANLAQTQMKPKLLYIYPSRSTFVAKDVSILSERFRVKEVLFAPKKKWHLPFLLVFDACASFFNVLFSDRIVVQFGGYHAVMPVLWAKTLGKPSAVVLGGYDAVALPEINYGAFANTFMRKAVVIAYKNASVLIPVHQSLIESSSTYTGIMVGQGVKHFIPNIKTPFAIIPNGYDPSLWKLDTHSNREFLAVTVASGLHEQRRKVLKGIDLFLAAAEKLPKEKFLIIGGKINQASPNVVCLENVPNEELPDHFNRCKSYLQLSLSEGFPNALCEAMLCGCLPVVSNVASMPEIIQDSGFILNEKDANKLVEILNKVPSVHSVNAMMSARNAVEARFSYNKRAEQLLKVIATM